MNNPLGQLGIVASTLNSSLNVKRAKFSISSLIFYLIFGATFTTAGLFAFSSAQIDKSWTRVQGEIVDTSSKISDDSTIYTPIVEYFVDGKSYRVTGNSGSSMYPSMGSTREVAYNPAMPNQSKLVEGVGIKLLLLLFPVVGILFLISGPYMLVKSLQRSKTIEKLLQTGNKLHGVLVDIQSVSTTGGGRGRGVPTFTIVVTATDSAGTVQNYVSDKLTGSIGQLAMMDFQKNPIPIDIYIDPTNPVNYYVDISMIPNLTPQRISELLKSASSSEQTPNTSI